MTTSAIDTRFTVTSLSPMSLPTGAIKSGYNEKALKLIQVFHALADKDLQGLIIPLGIMPVYSYRYLDGILI